MIKRVASPIHFAGLKRWHIDKTEYIAAVSRGTDIPIYVADY